MQKTQLWLGVLLGLQLLLGLGLFMNSLASGSVNNSTVLLSAATSDINRIAIEDGSNSVLLVKTDDNWTLSDPALPANSNKINTLLATLAGLRTNWPLADTESGRQRFEVTADKFQRHLQLYQDDALLDELYFGTSPGFRQTHARRAEEDEVYSLAFNNFDLPADANDWLDKSLLAASEPLYIEGADYVLQLQDESWQLNPDETGESVTTGQQHESVVTDQEDESVVTAQDKAKSLASALSNLRVLRVALPAASEGADVQMTELKVRNDTEEWTYHFSKHENSYLVSRSDFPQTFTLSSADYERIAGIQREDLLSMPAEAETDDAGTNPETSLIDDAGTDPETPASGAASTNPQAP